MGSPTQQQGRITGWFTGWLPRRRPKQPSAEDIDLEDRLARNAALRQAAEREVAVLRELIRQEQTRELGGYR